MNTPVSGSSTTDTTPPSTPTALTVSAVGQTALTLSWNPSGDNTGVTGYRTYLNGNQVGTPASTSYGYSNLSCATTYTLGVAAVDAAGNVSGIATLAKQTAACSDTTPPSAPGALTATAAASTEIDLSWGAATDNVGVTGYQIWRCQGAGCTTYSQLTQTTGSATTYKDLSPAPTTTYSYQVRALDAAGNTGPYTNSAQVATPGVPPPAMYAVGGTVSGVSGTVVLQDNGGDDLTLSGNGAFKFATQLASGAAYSVTVKTAPSGESCVVSNGSGTVGLTDVSSVGVACSAGGPASGSDDFNRADGGLGAAWAGINDGALEISSNVVVGSSATAGDVRVPETYGADQFSSIQLTSTQLSGGLWVGPAVRVQNSGLDMYLGIYFWNNGSPQLRLYKRSGGNWTQLGSSYNSGPLAAGTVLKLASVGSRIAFSQDGVERIVVSDSTISTGQPGILTYGAASADNWSAGPASIPPPAMYAVGGTVSGVSGTVVLQDNGGDDLTLSGNGAFKFATQLASGAAYSVTVKTAPSGESCVVSNGSGTVGLTDVSSVGVACSAGGPASGSDDFNRADGGLGAAWAGINDGALEISSNVVVGSSATAGDVRVPETYGADQFSSIQLTSTQLSGGLWVGPAVRVQNSGLDMYLGIYFWNNGSPQLRLYKRSGGNWTQLGSSYNSGPLAAGTVLKLASVGSRIAFSQDGVERIVVSDSTISTGQPGILTYGAASADNWSAGPASIPPPAMYAVGGTVSGVSGTVVLQDNGGDDLTLSGNGAFKFATQLASGAAYSVTVKTAPSGESCVVSNGSGTVGLTDVSSVGVACSAGGPASGSDDFNRADGGLGAAWAGINDGALEISSNVVVGSSATAGDVRVPETYGADQFSSIQLTSTQLSGGLWVGPAVRVQNSGLDMYLGIYFWNNGSPQLRLYKRSGGNWTQLGSSYNSGPLAAGTVLKLASVGSRIAFSQDGVERIVVSDSTISTGQPGILTYGAASADNWSAGPASIPSNTLQVDYTGTDANGVAKYNVTSPDDGGTQVMRVLSPTNPTPGVPHNFLFVLPVEAGLATVYGDGLETLRALDAQDQYNLTIIEPSFGIEPWYADNPNDPTVKYETFLTNDLVPWVTKNLETTGVEQKWLIGFSKSGIGATDLILRHPDVYTLAAAWDFPADMSTYDQYSGSASSYGTNDNFLTNYRLTPAFIDAHKAPFLSKNRIWIGGYNAFQIDMSDFDALLNSEAVIHSTETPQYVQHRWDSGWVQIALAALQTDSVNLP